MTDAQIIALIAAMLSGGKDWPPAESTIVMAKEFLDKVKALYP